MKNSTSDKKLLDQVMCFEVFGRCGGDAHSKLLDMETQHFTHWTIMVSINSASEPFRAVLISLSLVVIGVSSSPKCDSKIADWFFCVSQTVLLV